MFAKEVKVSPYHNSIQKFLFDYAVSIVFLTLTSPLVLLISLFITSENGSSIFFVQERTGKNGKFFKIIKFRTMKVGADKIQKNYAKRNEADGPVFKIENDPRFTKLGKVLSKTGLDELPQLVNVLKGEMSIVGPRPFPVNEAGKIPVQYKIRELVKPGITSTWVTKGAKHQNFKKWMELDKTYVKNGSLLKDLEVLLGTSKIILNQIAEFILKQLLKINN